MANKKLKLKLKFTLIILLIFSRACYSADKLNEKLNISVTHPWLALLASFIGGAEVEIMPLRIWDSHGDLIMTDKGKALKELGNESKIIALDQNEAVEAGINQNQQNNFNVRYLYSPFPVKTEALYDPSVIPFVAQRILTALSEWDSQNYPYYQRRLAEFQARLSGAILVGQVLKDVTVCDMGGTCGILLQAAGCKIEKPEELEKWQKGNFAGLRDYLEKNKAQNIITVFDDDTPNPLRKFLSGRADCYHWERPQLESDYPTFLHEQYISLWQKIISKPLPGQKRH